jgi:hypothetical protein
MLRDRVFFVEPGSVNFYIISCEMIFLSVQCSWHKNKKPPLSGSLFISWYSRVREGLETNFFYLWNEFRWKLYIHRREMIFYNIGSRFKIEGTIFASIINALDYLGSILQNSISAENFRINFYPIMLDKNRSKNNRYNIFVYFGQ